MGKNRTIHRYHCSKHLSSIWPPPSGDKEVTDGICSRRNEESSFVLIETQYRMRANEMRNESVIGIIGIKVSHNLDDIHNMLGMDFVRKVAV